MPQAIQLRLLTNQETAALTRRAKFNTLRPTTCQQCGHIGGFARQIFWIGSVSRTERSSEETQGLLRYHLRHRYGVDYVFFKSHGTAFYADSACCPQCGSTRIEFDLEFTDALLAEVTKVTGLPLDAVRRKLQHHVERGAALPHLPDLTLPERDQLPTEP